VRVGDARVLSFLQRETYRAVAHLEKRGHINAASPERGGESGERKGNGGGASFNRNRNVVGREKSSII